MTLRQEPTMAAVRIIITFLFFPTSCTSVTTTCEIPSVEAGRNATLTTHFSEDMRNAKGKDFIVIHQRHNSTGSHMINCRFTNGVAECDKTPCCTWESHVTDVFRVYIHNVSQEHEGKFWGVVLPAEGTQHTHCIFSLKAHTCSSASINATNSHKICDIEPVTIGKRCTVICNDSSNFHEMYTCIGSNKWSPELPDIFCRYHSEGVETNNNLYALISLILLISVLIAIPIVILMRKKRRMIPEEDARDADQQLLDGRKNKRYKHDQMFEKKWLKCVKRWYPHFDSQTYFVPTMHFIHVPYCMEKIAGKEELAPLIKEVAMASHSDVRDNRTLQQVLNGIQTLARNVQPKEAMFVVSQLQFDNYLGEPTFATAAALLPRPSTLPEDLRQQHYDKGDFDVLIIHKKHGLFTLEISSVGEDFTEDKATEEMEDADLINNVNEIIKQLNKNEIVLKHLTRDLQPKITKCLAIPNITWSHLQRTINRNPSFKQDLCKCLGVGGAAQAMKLCLLSDQLSDNQTPSHKNYSSPQTLGQWWRNVCNLSGAQPVKASLLYKQLLSRFCGPATIVKVQCFTIPRLNIRTRGEAVSETGERVASFVLFPQQVDILNQSPPRAFLSGPPGTGKTILLVLQGLTWIQRGYDVHVVSTWNESRAATFLIEHQLQETAKTSTARTRVHRHQFDFKKDEEVKTAVGHLKSISNDVELCVIADTVVRLSKRFSHFCEELNGVLSSVHIWGASMFHEVRPTMLEEFKLTRSLRSPPEVTSEVMEAEEIRKKHVNIYDVSVPTDIPPLKRISHHANQSGHEHTMPHNCAECGRRVALILGELNVGQTGDCTDSPPLRYCDVLVLCCDYPTDDSVDSNGQEPTTAIGLVKGLRDSHVPVRVVAENDVNAIRDTALHVGDFVTVANLNDVLGLERKVVIVENGTDTLYERLYAMSRCMSQLVVIDYSQKHVAD